MQKSQFALSAPGSKHSEKHESKIVEVFFFFSRHFPEFSRTFGEVFQFREVR